MSLADGDAAHWRVELSNRPIKDIDTLTPKLIAKLTDILRYQVAVDPFCGKRLVGDLKGYWSLRLTHQDRIVYRIDEQRRVIYVLRARTHYKL
jgi:Txe/YoeB family toxin of toxin-antitoxin system